MFQRVSSFPEPDTHNMTSREEKTRIDSWAGVILIMLARSARPELHYAKQVVLRFRRL